MAKITIEEGKTFTPSSTGIGAIRQVGPVFSGQGEDISRLGQTVADIGIDLKQKRDQAINLDYVTDSTVKAQKEIRVLKDRMLKELEDPKGYSDNFMKGVDEIHNRFLENAPSDAAKRSLQASFTGQKTNQFANAFNTENKLITDNILSNAIENVNTIGINVFDNPETFQQSLNELELISEGTDEVLDPQAQKIFKEESKKTLVDSYIKGLMDKNLSQAEKLVNSDEVKGLLSPTEILKYRSAVEAEKDRLERETLRKVNEKKAAIQLDREFGIFKGTVNQLQLDEDLENGLYGKKEYLNLSRKLSAKNKKESSIDESIRSVSQAISSGLPLDTSDSKVRRDLDVYYDNVIASQVKKENSEEVASTLMDKEVVLTFMNQFNYVPSAVKSNLMASLYNGNTKTSVDSAEILVNTLKDNPQLVRQFSGTKDLARARTITNSVRAGMSPEEALKVADNLLVEVNTAEYKQREADFLSNSKPFRHGKLTEFFRDDPNKVPPGMIADFETLYANYAIDFKMSLEDAEEHAYEILRSEWRVTDINGELEYMKYPPEIYYKKSTEEIRNTLNRDIKQHFPEAEGAVLSPIVETVNTGKPEYMLLYTTEDGIPLPLLDKKGSVVRWRPE